MHPDLLEHEIEYEGMGDLVKVGIVNVVTTPHAVGVKILHLLMPNLLGKRGLYKFSLAKYWRWRANQLPSLF